MTLDELIEKLRTELPAHQWLIRSGGDERQTMFPGIEPEPGEFFAHIFRGRIGPAGYAEDYWAYDDDPARAMMRAFDDAKARRHRPIVGSVLRAEGDA